MKILFTFILIIFFTSCQSQQAEIDKIDYYLDQSNANSGINNLKSLDFAKKASLLAEKINHSEKKAQSYLFIAKCLYVLDSYKESLQYIDKGLKEPAVINDDVLACSFKEVLALVYFATGFDDQGLREYFEIINLIKSNKDEESIRILSRTYAAIGAIYLNQNNFQSGHTFLDKAIKTNNAVSVDGHINERADLFNIKGYLCLYDNKEDSAYHYFQKSFQEIEKDQSITKYVQFTALGDYYYQIKEYQKALEYYLKTLADLKKHKMDKLDYSIETIKNISEIYGILNNPTKQNEYLLEYQKQNEILKKESKQNFQASINSILSKHTEKSFSRKTDYFIIFSVLTLFVLIIIWIYVPLKRKNTIKKKALAEAKKELLLKQEIILQNESDKKLLEDRLNNSLEDILQLAIKNDPSFLARFKEAYPEFCDNLLAKYPDMVNSELTFCAYLKLNLSTKEIATYTFVTPKAIELRKNRFRKKMNISSEENLYMWIDKI